MTRTRIRIATLAAAAAALCLAMPTGAASAAKPADVKVTVEARGSGYMMAACPITATNVGGTTAYNVNVAGFALSSTRFSIPELAPGESVTRTVDCGQGVPVVGVAFPLDLKLLNNVSVSWRLLPNR